MSPGMWSGSGRSRAVEVLLYKEGTRQLLGICWGAGVWRILLVDQGVIGLFGDIGVVARGLACAVSV